MNTTVGELIAILQPLKPETEIRNLQFEITVSADTLRKKESTPVTITQAGVAPLTKEQWAAVAEAHTEDLRTEGWGAPGDRIPRAEHTDVVPMDPGEGYRLLIRGEPFLPDDEVYRTKNDLWTWPGPDGWDRVSKGLVGTLCRGYAGKARRKLDPVATTEEPPKQKQWLPGMLADETTPEGTLVRFCDELPAHWTEAVRLTSDAYPLCGMDGDGQFFQRRASTGMGIGNWKYAVVVDPAGNYDRELLQKEIDKRKKQEALRQE